MTNKLYLLTAITLLFSCTSDPKSESVQNTQEDIKDQIHKKSPDEMLREAYQLFKEGDDQASIALANEVLELGKASQNDTLIGGALTSLCRNAQRSLDTLRLAELSEELEVLSASSGNQKWLMYRAHMNAEMWRLVGDMDRAEKFYDESMQISSDIGAKGMYMIDHFNKSFVSTAKGDFETARNLIKKYYELRAEVGEDTEDAYGLIALAYLLNQEGNYKGAHEVSVVTRRLFKEQNLFPEPPDEKPLLAVEKNVKEELDEPALIEISEEAATKSVSDLLETYLKP